MKTFIFLDLEDEHIGLFLRLAKLNRKFTRVISCLLPEIIQFPLLVLESIGQVVKLALELMEFMPKALKLLIVEMFLIF